MSIYAYAKPVYQPAMRVIIGITNAFPAVVITSIDGINPANNDYITGTIVRLDIPAGFGMEVINQQFGSITVLTPTTFSIPIDTTLLEPFSAPAAWPENQQQAEVIPFGEDNDILTAATVNVLGPII